MEKKYVLEIGRTSYYSSYAIDSRFLYDSYDAAKAAFDENLKDIYSDDDLKDAEILNACCNTINPEQEYLDSWMDDEQDLFMIILK